MRSSKLRLITSRSFAEGPAAAVLISHGNCAAGPAAAETEQSPSSIARSAELDFRFDLIDRYAAGKLDNMDLATIAWKATQAGARGVQDLAVNPVVKGDNHARAVRSALGLNSVKDEVLYTCRVPVWDVTTASRVVKDMLVKLPHETIARDFYNNRDAYIKARSDPDNIEVPAFLDHPVTHMYGRDHCWPIGYYTDKVKLGNESFYRGSVKCTVMRSSISVWLLKCSELCRCGCNGLCTMDALQMEMNWSFNSLQMDTFMEARFDNQPWLPGETSRKNRAGKSIGFRGVVNEYRADLPERCAAARVKTQGGRQCCLSCLATASSLHDRVAEVSITSVPWENRTHNTFMQEVVSHLVGVNIRSPEEKRELVAALVWHTEYPHGRRVIGSKGSRWGLATNDQLIVSDAIRNPHDLESLTPPFKVFFFRLRDDSGIVGVSLMTNIPGVHSFGIEHFEIQYFCECTLHTLDLGVAQRFCGTAMVRALRYNVYKLPFKAVGKLVRRGALTMGRHIKRYYKDEHAKNPWKKISTLSKTFNHKCLGKLKQPCLKAKGGQTRCLVKFCTGLMQKFPCGRNGELLAKAGEHLLEAYEVMDMQPRRMSLKARSQLVTAMVNHVVLYRAAGGHLVYKHHGAIHLACSAATMGNPKSVSTYEDEHENGIVAKVALHVHGSTFAKSIFERVELQNPERRMLAILP